jgi:hypothetical protein
MSATTEEDLCEAWLARLQEHWSKNWDDPLVTQATPIVNAPPPPPPTTAEVTAVPPYVPRFRLSTTLPRQPQQSESDRALLTTEILPEVHVLPITIKRVAVHATQSNVAVAPRIQVAPTYCYQCGALIPPWREACYKHDTRLGRGLPSAPRLLPLNEDRKQAIA